MGPDAKVRDRLIEEHLPLVRSIARRYARGPEPFDDLVQAGSEGLIKAVDRFDAGRGHTLAALAAPCIEGEIRHHLRDRAPLVRAPRGVRDLGAKARQAETDLASRNRRTPRTADLALALGLPEAAVGEALLSGAVAAGAPLAEDDAISEPADDAADDRAALAQAWERLSPRDRRLLELRYHADLSQSEIARRIGRSQAQVSRSLAAALEHLRAAMGAVADVAPPAYSEPEMPASPDRPEPARSGRFLVRMPQSLHDALAHEAEREGVSLNTMICASLAAAIGWRDGEHAADERPGSAEGSTAAEPTRRVSRLLAANLVVVGIVAIAAVVLLVLAAVNG